MDVNYTNDILNTVKTLRESIYNTDQFKTEFSSELESSIAATNTSYIPDQFGGWNVQVTIDQSVINNESNTEDSTKLLIDKVTSALTTSIHNVNKSISSKLINPSNLTNIVLSGPSSITVKL